jgi:hypothetical protein
VPADLQLSCKREQKQIIFGYAERSRQSMKLIVVQVRVRVKCIVDSYPDLIITTFAIVPADLHELLSTAKNLPEMNIRIYLIRLLPILKYAIVPADLRSAGIKYKNRRSA